MSKRLLILLSATAAAVLAAAACSSSDEADDSSEPAASTSCDRDAEDFVTALFGADADAVVACLGDPDERYDTESGVILAFPADGLEIGIGDDGVNEVIAYGEVAAGTDRPDYNAPFSGSLPGGVTLSWVLDDFVDLYGDPVETTEVPAPTFDVGARYEVFETGQLRVQVTRHLELGEISSILYRRA